VVGLSGFSSPLVVLPGPCDSGCGSSFDRTLGSASATVQSWNVFAPASGLPMDQPLANAQFPEAIPD
jgi:hypothetical protein